VRRTLPCTTACSPYTMTLPGADTMKGGIIGDDCFRFMAGFMSVVEGAADGILEANCVRAVSTGECSGVCVDCDVERCWTVTAGRASTMTSRLLRLQDSRLTRRGEAGSANAAVDGHARRLQRACMCGAGAVTSTFFLQEALDVERRAT
jgi:hypothetical protein